MKKILAFPLAIFLMSLIISSMPQVQGAEGDFIDSWDTSVESNDPYGITTDGNFIWIVDTSDDEVYKYTMAGVYTTDHFDTSAHGGVPFAITIHGSNIWIGDVVTDIIYKYDLAGNYISEFYLGANYAFYCITTDGNFIWMVDYASYDEVYKYTMAGVYTNEHWDTSGEMNTPLGITTDGNFIWIYGFTNEEVYKYFMNGTYTTEHWDTSAKPGFYSMATDGDFFWFVEFNNDEVYKFEGPPSIILPPSDPDLLFGAGFNASSPFVELHWNHSLIDVQFFEIHNSSDGLSWAYLGQSNTANYTDTQVNNGTERFYRVRAVNQTGGTWYNSSWSAVNFETVYFIPDTGNLLNGSWVDYNLTEIGVTRGTLDSGNLASTYFIDGDMFNVSEVAMTPGMGISANITGIDENAISLWITIYALYDGNLNHDFDIEVWDFTNSVWVEDSHIEDGVVLGWVNSTIYDLRIPVDFLNAGEVRIRLDHESPGNINHDLFIDYFRVQAFVPTGLAVAGVGVGANWGLLWFFLILICVPILLVLLKGSRR